MTELIRALLKVIHTAEWSGSYAGYPACPVCHVIKPRAGGDQTSHTPQCEIAIAIAKAETWLAVGYYQKEPEIVHRPEIMNRSQGPLLILALSTVIMTIASWMPNPDPRPMLAGLYIVLVAIFFRVKQ
jgi:hypothetical protein